MRFRATGPIQPGKTFTRGTHHSRILNVDKHKSQTGHELAVNSHLYFTKLVLVESNQPPLEKLQQKQRGTHIGIGIGIGLVARLQSLMARGKHHIPSAATHTNPVIK